MNWRGCLLSGSVILVSELLALGVFAITVGHFLTTADTAAQADAIIVLGGEAERAELAVDLHNAGYAPTVVFSGGTLKDAGLDCSSARLSLEAAQQLGLPANAAVIADGAQSTYQEAVNVRRLTQQHNWHALIIVTGLYHTRRAARTFRTLMPDTKIYITAVPDADDGPNRWWRTEDGLVAVITEILKLGFYWVKYGIAPVG